MSMQWNIRNKMIVAIAIAIIVTLGVGFLILLSETKFRQALVEKERISDEVISVYLANDISASLRFRKGDKIEEQFGILFEQKGDAILYLVAYTNEGEIIAHKGDMPSGLTDNRELLKGSGDQLSSGRSVSEQTDDVINMLQPVVWGPKIFVWAPSASSGVSRRSTRRSQIF